MLHKVVLEHLKALIHTFADGYARYHDYELAPAVAFVQFEHRLDIDVGLSGTGLHFDVESHTSEVVGKGLGFRNVLTALGLLDLGKDVFVGKFDVGVAIARIFIFIDDCRSRTLPDVPAVQEIVPGWLSGEDTDGAFNSVSLVLLYLEVEFHFMSSCLISFASRRSLSKSLSHFSFCIFRYLSYSV